jgi:hypothetical protein
VLLTQDKTILQIGEKIKKVTFIIKTVHTTVTKLLATKANKTGLTLAHVFRIK